MASTYSNLKIQLMATGENNSTWGNVTNTNLGTAIEEAIVGSADVTFASGNVTLTLTNTNATQTARNLRLNLTGTTGGARNLVVPAIEKVYIINNGCADAVTVKNTTGSGIAVPAGKTMYVYNNGTDVVDAITHLTSLTLGTPLAVTQGGTGGNTASDARTALGLGTMSTQNANSVSISGGSITGITDLAVADGGTGASDAGTARTNLDVPSRAGSGASGTWGINISGSAASATTATSATSATTATTLANATGSAPAFAVRAWVNFDGTGSIGTNMTIRASGNVSSVYKYQDGGYQINFSTAMPDANYAVSGVGSFASPGGIVIMAIDTVAGSNYTTSAVKIQISNPGSAVNPVIANVIVVR